MNNMYVESMDVMLSNTHQSNTINTFRKKYFFLLSSLDYIIFVLDKFYKCYVFLQYQKKESSMGMKALKYGLPLAGVGLGAYALGGGFSRSSSSSDDDWLG